MFIEILKDAFKLMRKNLNLTQLIFIFFILITLIAPVFSSLRLNIKAIPFILLFFAVVCMFFAGLFYAFKKSVDYETEPPKNDNTFDLSPLYFAEFFQGVGGYFIKFLFAGIFVTILFILLSMGFDYFVAHYIVIPAKIKFLLRSDIIFNDVKLNEFVTSLTQAEKIKLGKLCLSALSGMFLFGYFTMLYPIILVVKENNFFKSLFISIKYLFKNIPISLILFVFFNTCLLMTSLINASVANNFIVSILVILLQCYLNVWYILSLFVYYEKVK
ncbi:MAG: hypothetical protein MJ180_03745 [Candidatus Gastranaerophilales bacterium]|nr:hypothetical protein [Candidatus Gastranaerophilales bacterium]